MPPTGQPFGRTALPTKTVDNAAYVGLAERMAQDYFRLGASHRADQDAASLASVIQVPETGGITGTTGYEGMLQPDQEQPEFSGGEPQATSFGDTRERPLGSQARSGQAAMMAMPEAPELAPLTQRQPVTQEQGQSFELPGSQPTAPVDVSFPAATSSSAQAIPFSGGGAASAPGGGGSEAAPAGGEIEAYIRHAAARRGIDPDVAVRVARSEGGLEDPVRQSDVVYQGQREQSYGPLQLNVNGGVGSAALRAGIDPRNPAQWRQALDFGLDEVARAGWGQWHGAARVGIGDREGIGTYRGPPPPAPPQATQRAAEDRSASGERAAVLQGITPPQFGLGDADADSICGPVLAMAFAKSNGRNPSIDEAKQMAATHGRWTSAQGMGGPEAMAQTLRAMNIPAHYAPGALDIDTIRRETQNGNPVGINTAGHYFVVEGVDADGRLDLGNSAKALRASGGRQWFRPDEIQGLGMGAPTGAIYKDAPSSPTPSVAVAATGIPPVAHPEARQAMAPEQRREHDALSLAALSDPSTGAEDLRMAQMPGQGYSDASFGMGRAQPAAAPPVRDDYRMDEVYPWDPRTADQGPHEQPYPGTVVPIQNPDGSKTTERSITVTEPDLNQGQPTNIPTVWSGQVVDDDTAITNAVNSRRNWPSYPSIDAAVTAAEQRSDALGAGGTSIGGAVPFAAPAPAEQPGLLQGLGQGLWDAGSGAVGAVQGAVTGAVQGATDAAGRAVGAVQDAYAVPPEQRPPQYRGPSYAQPTLPEGQRPYFAPTEAESTAFTQGIEDARAAAPVEQIPIPFTGASVPVPASLQRPVGAAAGALGALNAVDQAVRARIDPRVWGFARDGIRRELFTPEQLHREAYLRGAMDPETGRRHVSLTQDEQDELAAMDQAVEQRYQQIKDDPDALTRYANASPAYGPTSAITDIALTPALGAAAGGAATRGAEALGAGARTARGIGYGADIAAQTVVDPTTPFTQGPLDAAVAGARRAVGAARALPGQVGSALSDNAQRMAAADARMAAEGSTATPGVFGLSGIEPGRPEVQGMRPRIIPPDVADSLDFPIRLPEDPSVIRAIEAAGGTVDERGTTLNVIRHQDPEAAGGAATRSATFYTAAPPGSPSPYARQGTVGPQGVGGQQRIEGPTRFRNPLFISDAPGEAAGFDDAMRQMAPDHAAELARAREELQAINRDPSRNGEFMPAFERIQALQQAEPPTAEVVEAGIAAAKRAGPAGSPERAQALKDLVSKYGGDPDVIDDLIALRGAEMGESVYAVKENIVAGNARRAGHDGVITIQRGQPNEAAVALHPKVVAAKDALTKASEALDQAADAHDATPNNANWRAVLNANKAVENAEQNWLDTLDIVRKQESQRITELADPRELRNPTPGERNPRLTRLEDEIARARSSEEAAYQARREAMERWYDEHPGWTTEEADAFRASPEYERLDEALAQAAGHHDLWRDALRSTRGSGEAEHVGPPGYTLRPDIPRRAPPSYEDLVAQWNALAERNRQAIDAGDRATAQRLKPQLDDLNAALKAAEPPTRGPGSEIAQASAGALPAAARSDPLASVNRALSQGVVSSVSGGVGAQVNQEMNPDDPYAGIKGFAAGALVPPLAQRGARSLARLAGAAPPGAGTRALATAGGLPPVDPDEIADLARRAAEQPVRGPRPESKQTVRNVAGEIKRQADAGIPPEHPEAPMPPPDPPPGWWDHAENWRYNVGLFGQIATGMVQAVGGGITAIGGGTAEAIRLAVLRGQGEALPLILGEGIKAVPGGVASSLRTAAGQVPKAIEAGSDYRPSLGARERAAGRPVRGAVADIVGTPGRVVTQAPDAFWHELFYRSGIAQAAADAARTEFGGGASIRGITGGVLGAGAGYETTPEDASPWERLARTAGGAILGGGVASLGPNSLARAQRTRELIANPTPEILAQAAKLAQDATFKGEPGALLGAPKRVGRAISEQIPSEATRTVLGAAGSFLMPIYNTIARIHEEGLKIAPGVGMLPLERVGLGPKGAARGADRRLAQQAVGLAFGASALGYAASGGIRGPGPSNPNEAQAMRDQGYTTNTTNVAGYWVPNSWFGEYGPYLNEIGAINDARLYDHGDKSWDDVKWWQQGEALVKNSARAARDYPALDAASTLTQLFTKPVDALTSLAGEVAAQYVPGPVRTAAMATDPTTRTRTRGDAVPPEQRVEETFRQRSGIGREQLPAAQDILGRDVPNRRQGWAAVLPNVGQDRPDPIIQSYLDANLTIGDPPTRLSIPDLSPQYQSPELTPEETRRWNTLRGDAIIRTVGPLLDSPGWASATPEQRAAALEQRRTQAAAYAHRILRSEIGDADLKRRLDAARAGKRAS